MFKGIVEALGLITKLIVKNNQIFFTIEAGDLISKVELGSSIACNGVCLTVTDITGSELGFYASQETCNKTNLGALTEGSKINLETSLKIGDTLDGHFVQGHVDTTTTVLDIKTLDESHIFTFALTKEVAPYITYKGSVAIDGTSLTVNEVLENSFNVNIIPYTWNHTIFHNNKVGDKVNIESDLIARYIKRLLEQSGVKG